MPSKKIIFLLNLHHPYIKQPDSEGKVSSPECSLLFEDISSIYVPLLQKLEQMKSDGVKFKIAMVFSAPLCTLLTDKEVCAQYEQYLDSLIELGKKEVKRTKKDIELNRNARENLERVTEIKRLFFEVYSGNIIKHFAKLAKEGYIELLATAASYAFLPHYADLTEILNAQIEAGLCTVRAFFGIRPEGFFLPEMGYVPGIENVLKSYGVAYTLLPSQSFLFSSTTPSNGIFTPARTMNSLSIFAAEQIKTDYAMRSVYKNQGKDISWELKNHDLLPFIEEGEPRRKSSFCYWNNISRDDNFDDEGAIEYNSEESAAQVKEDAADFFETKKALLEKAAQVLPDTDVSYTCVFDIADMAHEWAEAVDFITETIRLASSTENNENEEQEASESIQIATFTECLLSKKPLQKINPYPAAFSGAGYGENYISSRNEWMIRYLRKAAERIVELADRFPNDTGLKARLLNLGSREFFIASDSSWAKMIGENNYSDYAEKIFKECIVAFSMVFDSLGSNTVSTEWLCNLEKKHAIFPWMNYRIFSPKK